MLIRIGKFDHIFGRTVPRSGRISQRCGNELRYDGQ